LSGSVSDWPLLCRRTLENLNPGGWFELQDYDVALYAYNDPELNTAPKIREWQILVNLAADKFGRAMNIVSYLHLATWLLSTPSCLTNHWSHRRIDRSNG
jgi:hypothetical protein